MMIKAKWLSTVEYTSQRRNAVLMLSMGDLDLKNHVLLIQAIIGFQHATKRIT